MQDEYFQTEISTKRERDHKNTKECIQRTTSAGSMRTTNATMELR